MMKAQWRFRAKAAGVHALVSLLVAACCAWLIYAWWYPSPYAGMSGSTRLFLIVMGVDLVMGPVLTIVASNPTKRRRQLIADWSLIAILQCAALGYGVHAVAQARPVVLAWEGQRFRLVSAAQVPEHELAKAPQGLQVLSWRGPVLVDTRAVRDEAEKFEAITMAVAGYDVGSRPSFWQPWTAKAARTAAAQECQVDVLRAAWPHMAACPVLLAKAGDWRVLLKADGTWLGIVADPGAASD
jgi:hypothetical protein